MGGPIPKASTSSSWPVSRKGYHRPAGAITEAQLRGGEKGRPVYDLDKRAERAGGQWVVLTGCRKGVVRRALTEHGPDAASRELDRLVGRFGADSVNVELTRHGNPPLQCGLYGPR